MVLEYSTSDVENMKKITLGEIDSLREYLAMLNQVLENSERDILATRVKAKIFISIGQVENHGYLMERIHETETRVQTVKKCIEECEANISYKEDRIKYYHQLLGSR